MAARPDPANPATATLTAKHWEAVEIDSAGVVSVADVGTIELVELPALLAAHGWPSTPVPQPTGRSDLAWARLVNVALLLPGVTKLRDELRLLDAADQIADSSFGAQVDWTWNGTAFAP